MNHDPDRSLIIWAMYEAGGQRVDGKRESEGGKY